MNWLVTKLIDSGWVRSGLAFRWIFGTQQIFTRLVNQSELEIIEKRYRLIERSGFFSGKNGAKNQQAFIMALFAYDSFKADAFGKALSASYSFNRGSVEPLRTFLDFIERCFFSGAHATSAKQSFIDAVLTNVKGESNALSRAAWSHEESHSVAPVELLLESLGKAGCYQDDANKQKLINGICAFNRYGDNALSQALGSSKSYSSFQTLLDALNQANCFDGSHSESNKTLFIQAIANDRALSKVMIKTDTLKLVLLNLTTAGCFDNADGIAAFIDALTKPDGLGMTALYSIVLNFKSYQLVQDLLTKNDCFNTPEHKQSIISAILRPLKDGVSLYKFAGNSRKTASALLDLLTWAGCFEGEVGSPNQQAFVESVLALGKDGLGVFNHPFDEPAILNKLMELKYFEGPYGEQNKAAFIKIILHRKKSNDCALATNRHTMSFPFIIEHLRQAGCFSGSNKRAFMHIVFSNTESGKPLISSICTSKSIVSLLEALGEAGCYDDEVYNKKFRRSVCADGHPILFYAIGKDVRDYSVLYASLQKAGFKKEDISQLLNEPVKFGSFSIDMVTPLMVALCYGYSDLAAELRGYGAEITDEQQQQVDAYLARKNNIQCSFSIQGEPPKVSELSMFPPESKNPQLDNHSSSFSPR